MTGSFIFFLNFLGTALTVSLLFLISLLVFRLTKTKLTAKCRYIVCICLTLRLLIPLGVLSMTGILPSAPMKIKIPIEAQTESTETKPAETNPRETNPPVTTPQETVQPSETAPVPETTIPHETTKTPETTGTNVTEAETTITETTSPPDDPPFSLHFSFRIITTVWLIGIGVYLIWQFGSYFLYDRSIRPTAAEDEHVKAIFTSLCDKKGLKKRPRLMISDTADSPMICGFLRTKLILPAFCRDYDEKDLSYILTHELTHYKRGDIWIKLSASVACSVHWYNPLVYLLTARLSTECEISCDEEVTSGLTDEERTAYGNAILETVRRAKQNKR